MNLHKLAFEKTGFFPSLIIDYLNENDSLSELVSGFPSKETFGNLIEKRKSFPSANRQVLVKELEEQYAEWENPKLNGDVLDKLNNEKTFTVTTGHQLNIFTGPLFFIYKITSTIKLCQQLAEWFPEYDFVPVYWMATEDHDLEEIDHTTLFNKPLKWDTEQTGPVGRMNLSGFDKTLEDAFEILGDSEKVTDLKEVLKEAYKSMNLSLATRKMVDFLFGDKGLVILDADNAELKRFFAPVMEKELESFFSAESIQQSNQKLEELGHSPQVHAREINLFYIEDGLRERIVEEDGKYSVLNTDISWTKEALHEMLQQNPERFSPNVVLRPVYQEVILPNLAYIGGGGELSYWLQLKSVFEAVEVTFPLLILRNSALIVDGGNSRKMKKLEISIEDLFEDEEWLVKHYITEHADVELDQAREHIKKAFQRVVRKAKQLDPTLEKKVKAEEQSQLKSLDNLEKRLIKAAKHNQETQVRQIRQLKQHLFPNNSLQERRDNFMEYYLKHGQEFFDLLLENFDPLDKSFYVFIQE